MNKQPVVVMDAKWKLIDANQGNTPEKYGLSQGDFYQLLAYGQKYQPQGGELFLIYPKHEQFEQPLPEFMFSENLTLWVVPFDLVNDQVIGIQGDCISKKISLQYAKSSSYTVKIVD